MKMHLSMVIAAVFALCAATFTSCSDNSDDDKEQTVVTLNVASSVLEAGQLDTLVATVVPTSNKSQVVTWKSSDSSVATVSDAGVVTAIKKGITVITATATDGSNANASCVVAVAPASTGYAKATIDGKEVMVKWVQLWNDGPKFATVNIGASKETDLGTKMIREQAVLAGSDYAWGPNWKTEWSVNMDVLYPAQNGVTRAFVQENGVWGVKFTGEAGTIYAKNSIFLPIEGATQDGCEGYYWANDRGTEGCGSAMHLQFTGGVDNCFWDHKHSVNHECYVRPVLVQ